jgi:RND family efflux transporter MFP subunit
MEFIKKRKIYIGIIVLVVVVFALSSRGKKVVYEEAKAEIDTLIQEVSVTGTVKPIMSVDLAFERTGRVVSSPVVVGQKVVKGQTLLSLDSTSDVLALRKAEANLAADEAKLEQLKAGTRAEDMDVLISKRDAAQIALSDELVSLKNTLKDAYTKADDAVRNNADQFFDNARSSNPQINITVNSDQLKQRLNQTRANIETDLISWANSLNSIKDAYSLAEVTQTREYLEKISLFLSDLALAVNSLTPTPSLSLTTISGYKTDVSTARAAVNTAISGLSSADESYNTSRYALDLASKNLNVAIAGAAKEDILAAEANILADKAEIASIKHSIALASIRAPFDGVVSKQDAKIGQVVSINDALVSLIGENKFEIEANVPEADIAKLSVGNRAKVTLDAYGSDTIFDAEVVSIDPAETLIDNVATYKVTFSFLLDDPRVRSGMTANIDILSAEKPNTLLIPSRAVKDSEDGKAVRIKNEDGSISLRTVIVGMKSSDGRIEIISGLEEGDLIIIGEK